MNIDLSVYSKGFINNVIAKKMNELNVSSIEEFETVISQNQDELEEVRSLLSNSYSIFFRNRFTFEFFNHLLLSKLYIDKTHTGNELRIWSAGCAEGQEVYSLAILIEDLNEMKQTPLKYRIFATDREFANIEKASIAIYKTEALQNVISLDKEKWFKKINSQYKLDTRLKRNIQFELLDLLGNDAVIPKLSIFGNFDVIMCANVLIYYNKEVQLRILNNFKKSLSKDGYLITGEVERELFMNNGFVEVYEHSCIFKIKH